MKETLEIISIVVALILGIVGIILTSIQICNSNEIKKAEFIFGLIEKLRYDDNVTNAMNAIDYDVIWYDKNFHESEYEKEFDALFSILDYTCYLYQNKFLKDKEFAIFSYEILRVCEDEQCKNYFWNLHHFSEGNSSFPNLIKYLKSKFSQEELNDFESEKPRNKIYIRYLNF